MSEATEQLQAHKTSKRIRGEERRFTAAEDFYECAVFARLHGFTLRQCCDSHYQIFPVDRQWLLNIYPGNLRLQYDKDRRGPRVFVKADWQLMDVVKAVILLDDPNATL